MKVYYNNFSTFSTNAGLATAPTCLSTNAPSLKKRTVGMFRCIPRFQD